MTWKWQKSATPNDAVNLAPATGAVAVFNLKEALKQLNPTGIKASSDGTTYNASGDQITTGGSGAGGMANNNAWWRYQFPDGKEVTFQRGTGNTVWRVKWSHSATFTGGSPGATQTPSATDEQIVAGGGTDAAPTFLTWFTTDNTYKQHIGFDDAAPYDVWCALVPNSGGATRRFWRITAVNGSYPSADVAPYIVDVTAGDMTANSLGGVQLNGSSFGQGYYKKGLAGESWRAFRACALVCASVTMVPGALPVNPYDGDDNVFPIGAGRISGTDVDPGWKGWFNTNTLGWTGSSRNDGDVFDIGANRYAVFDSVSLRWPTGVTPSL